jgi:hypothetical protein
MFLTMKEFNQRIEQTPNLLYRCINMVRPSMLRSTKSSLSGFPANSESIRPAELRETTKFLVKISVIRILGVEFLS